MITLPAQTARVPTLPRIIKRVKHRLPPQIVLLGLRDRFLRLPRQARHVRDAQFWRRNAVAISTRASAHEAFSRVRVHGLETDVAFLPLRVVRARLDRDRDGLLVFFVGVVLFRASSALNPSTERLVSAPFPVLSLAGLIAISGLTPTAPFLVIEGQWGGAGGAVCEDHLGL
jgi:hypothetical protein